MTHPFITSADCLLVISRNCSKPLCFVPLSVITEIGRCAKAYCEHTARSVPTLSDTVVTLIEMGKYWRTPTYELYMLTQGNREDMI